MNERYFNIKAHDRLFLSNMMSKLELVKDFWNSRSCGEVYAKGSTLNDQYRAESKSRYELEPYILDFAKFSQVKDKKVLEIGVGMGADHEQFAISKPQELYGIDLTERAIEHCKKRLALSGLKSFLDVGNAESLKYPNDFFDFVYSWGVLHHSPDTEKAIGEIYRVLKPGAAAKIMIYHKYSVVGFLLWVRYALLTLKPWRDFNFIYNHFLESPGTKAYSVQETLKMCSEFSSVKVKTLLSFGDLLEGEVGQRHRGILLKVFKRLWPRSVIKKIAQVFNFGLYLLIDLKK